MPKLPDEKPETPQVPREKPEAQVKAMLKRAGRKASDVDSKPMGNKTEVKKALLELHSLKLEDYERGYIA